MSQDFLNTRIVGAKAGRKAPEFTTTTLDGRELKLADFRGKFVLLDFWATWCAPCVAELPNVQSAHKELAGKGLEVVSISFDKKAETAAKFMKDRGIAWPQVWAEGADKGTLAQFYGVGGIPATFLIDPDGMIVATDLKGAAMRETIAREMAKRTDGSR